MTTHSTCERDEAASIVLEILTLNEKGSLRVNGFGFCILEILWHAKEEKVHFGHLYYHIISQNCIRAGKHGI